MCIRDSDNVLGFVFGAPFGIPDVVHGVKNIDQAFYFVEKDDKQFFVIVTDEFIETRQLTKYIAENKFDIGEWRSVSYTHLDVYKRQDERYP